MINIYSQLSSRAKLDNEKINIKDWALVTRGLILLGMCHWIGYDWIVESSFSIVKREKEKKNTGCMD